MSLEVSAAVRVKKEPEWEDKMSSQGLRAEHEVKEEPESPASAPADRMVKEEREWTSEEVCGVRAAGEGPEREEDGQPGYLDRKVKEEREWENSCHVSPAAKWTGLFIGQAVKEEIMVGPEELHRAKQLLACLEPSEEQNQNEKSVTKSTMNKKSLILQSTPAKERSHKCNHCSYATDIRANLQRHVKIHYRCVYCNHVFADETSLLVHVNKHSIGKSHKPYKCAQCSFTSASKINLELHKYTHTGEKPYKCADCSFVTACEDNLQKHKKAHTGKKQLKRATCNFAIEHGDTIYASIHPGEKQYKCTHCGYVSAYRGNLRRHKITHSDEKPYKCAHCSFATAHSVSLKVHTRRHTGEKPYNCTQCSYAGASRSHLQHHKKNHTGEKPYKCAHCSFATTSSVNLKFHTRKHTGEKLNSLFFGHRCRIF